MGSMVMLGWRIARVPALMSVVVGLVILFGSAPATAQEVGDLEDIQLQLKQLEQAGKYNDALALVQNRAREVEKAERAVSGRSGAKTAAALLTLSWEALLARNFELALAASNRAH